MNDDRILEISAVAASPALVRPPLQQRSRETHRKIIDAAKDILIAKGISGLTLQEVAQRAGVSNGALHYRFNSKEALSITLITHLLHDIRDKERIMHNKLIKESRNIDEMMRSYIKEYFRIMQDFNPIFNGSIGVIKANRDLSRLGVEVAQEAEDLAKATFLSFVENKSAARQVEKADEVFHIIFSFVIREIQFPSSAPGSPQRLRRQDALARMCVAYLQAGNDGPFVEGA
ncbi:hypothetical protein DM806_09030 [Sphingobium lactosutens]|uniref:TetR/AcrR family transcriptional regulator n=1 Tax=Sphingobium lactosutens TaxID=522773 RepID=UPI0015BD12F5|nr:TetR/AcrR family transcriptional regulator [Sphingobium lactosutens]NWK95816.1 hypothetical protein [Sphingobium lactosutens]